MLRAVQIANVLLESDEFDPSELASEVQMYPAIESWEGVDPMYVTLANGRIVVEAKRNPKNFRERYSFEITIKVPWAGAWRAQNVPRTISFRTNLLEKGKQKAVAHVRQLMKDTLPSLMLGVDLYQKTYEQMDSGMQAAFTEFLVSQPEADELPQEFDAQTPESHRRWMQIIDRFLKQYHEGH